LSEPFDFQKCVDEMTVQIWKSITDEGSKGVSRIVWAYLNTVAKHSYDNGFLAGAAHQKSQMGKEPLIAENLSQN